MTPACLGIWLITAAIISYDGGSRHMITANPTTRFDLEACQKTAAQKNREYREHNIVGFVTCVRSNEG